MNVVQTAFGVKPVGEVVEDFTGISLDTLCSFLTAPGRFWENILEPREGLSLVWEALPPNHSPPVRYSNRDDISGLFLRRIQGIARFIHLRNAGDSRAGSGCRP